MGLGVRFGMEMEMEMNDVKKVPNEEKETSIVLIPPVCNARAISFGIPSTNIYGASLRQGKTRQDKTRQDKTREDKTGQDKTV